MSWDWTFHFEVAFDVDPGTVPAGGDWTDLSGRVRSRLETSRGGRSSRALVDLNNRDRALDPTNTSATYNLVPLRHARIAVTVDAVRYPLWQGYVENWSPHWPGYNDATVHVKMVDSFAWLALQDADLDLPEQTSRERAVAVLDAASWPAGPRVLIGGISGGKRLDAFQQKSANLLRVLEDTADAEDGELFCDAEGRVVFRHRHWRFDSTSALTVGASGTPVGSVIPIYDTAWLTNQARVELANGDTYEWVDTSSVAAYGPRVFPVRDLSLPPAESEALAQWVVNRYAEPLLWLDRVELKWADPDVDIATVVQIDKGDLVTFTHTPPGGGTVSFAGHVERVETVAGRGDVSTFLDLSPYFGEGPWFTLDDATLGLLGTSAGNKIAP